MLKKIKALLYDIYQTILCTQSHHMQQAESNLPDEEEDKSEQKLNHQYTPNVESFFAWKKIEVSK